MRILVLFLAAGALAGCRSSGRDYLSVNRDSLEFLRESVRDSRKIRRQEWREATNFSERARENREMARDGRRFARDSILIGEWQNFQELIAGLKREWGENTTELGDKVRFGFLDSGD